MRKKISSSVNRLFLLPGADFCEQVQKMIELGNIFPPLYLSHNLDKLIERGDLEEYATVFFEAQQKTSPISKCCELCLVTFSIVGQLEFAGVQITVEPGTYMIPLHLTILDEILASSCVITYYRSMGEFAAIFSLLNFKNAMLLKICDHIIVFGEGMCAVVEKTPERPFGPRNVFMPCRFSGKSGRVEELVELGVLERNLFCQN